MSRLASHSWAAGRSAPRSEALVIDAHSHMGPAFADKPTYLPGATGDEIVELLDRASIDLACIFAPIWEGPTFVDPDFHQANASIAAAVKRFPDRLIGYARVDPNQRGLAIDELRRCHDEYGFKGLKLHPLWEHFETDNLRLMAPIADFCAEHRWPMFFHGGYYPTCQPALFMPLAERYPDVAFIIAHFGYAHTADAIIAADRYPNIYLETAANTAASAIQEALRRVDPRQILYGSDLPFTDPEDAQEKFRQQPLLTDEARALIFGGNMARLLGLSDVERTHAGR